MTAIQHITNATGSIRPTQEIAALVDGPQKCGPVTSRAVDGAAQGTLESAVDARLTALSRDISAGSRER